MKDSKDDALNDFKIAWKMGLGHSGKLFEGKNPISKKNRNCYQTYLENKEDVRTKCSGKFRYRN